MCAVCCCSLIASETACSSCLLPTQCSGKQPERWGKAPPNLQRRAGEETGPSFPAPSLRGHPATPREQTTARAKASKGGATPLARARGTLIFRAALVQTAYGALREGTHPLHLLPLAGVGQGQSVSLTDTAKPFQGGPHLDFRTFDQQGFTDVRLVMQG